METITYDDFAKLTIVIGTITVVEEVPDSNKLLKLTVEVGEEIPRQILSGIKKYFADPQTLVGVQTPFLINLETKVIAGLESKGMILAASNDEAFSLLTVSTPLPSGSTVR
jgi:methionyl-tRNA synthetase